MNKHIIFKILTVWFILTQAFPPINVFFPIPGKLQFPIFVGITMALFPDLLKRKSFLAFFVYIMIAFLFFLGGNDFYGQIGRVTTPLMNMSAGLLLAEYTLKYDYDYKYTRLVVFVVIIANVAISLISIPEIYKYPNIIRFAFKEDATERFGGLLHWLISYQTCHGLPFLFAPLILLCKKTFGHQRWAFAFWLFSTVILFYIVYLSNATTALIAAIITLVMALLTKRESFDQRSVISLGFLALLGLFLTLPSVLVPILDGVQGMMDESWMNYHKINELKNNVLYGTAEGDLETRGDLYKTSLELFINSPILGTSHPELISHHSWFLDNLACFGMFLIIPVILVLVYNIKSMYKNLVHTKVVYMYGVLAWVLLIVSKNEFGQGTWLYGFAFLPLLCRYIDYLMDNKLIKK